MGTISELLEVLFITKLRGTGKGEWLLLKSPSVPWKGGPASFCKAFAPHSGVSEQTLHSFGTVFPIPTPDVWVGKETGGLD
jgi:hypothetical protein